MLVLICAHEKTSPDKTTLGQNQFGLKKRFVNTPRKISSSATGVSVQAEMAKTTVAN